MRYNSWKHQKLRVLAKMVQCHSITIEKFWGNCYRVTVVGLVFVCLLALLTQSKSPQNVSPLTMLRAAATFTKHPMRSHLTPDFLACMEEVGKNLPIRRDGHLVAHHFDAGTGKWNEEIRFKEFDPFVEAPLIMDVGGNVNARDSRKFRQMFSDAELHIYEPVPAYFGLLHDAWLLDTKAHTHNFGLGGKPAVIVFDTDALKGEATFIMGGRTNGPDGQEKEIDTITMEVKDGAQEVARLLTSLDRSHVDVLHVNCEGCEWDFFERLLETDTLRQIKYIQMSFHNYGERGIGNLLPRYCMIREGLLRTHKKVVAFPFGWERWMKSDS